uniref:serine/threonine-protein kinase ULK4 n=1 Tax=Doryrhamphus excisus TaxID=161450 RepID=UPI0025AE54D4|nr:serine/threonine-protein kinase ULK4 [Doryrhamphus excisus]
MENFILYEELGGGSSSVVHKGRRKGNLNYVALKCSDKAKRPEITNHVRLSQDVDHPNVVRFYEWYETKKHLWLVTELCTGGSLESVIKRDGCLPEDTVRKFGWDLVQGLDHIYKLGIIFSDLTPSKILLDSNGILKLGNFCHSKTESETLEDFLSLCCEEAGDEKYDDLKKRFQGSTAYMAPEVLEGSETTVISDLWALGCILYHMYTGRLYCADNYNEVNLHQQASFSVSPTSSPSPEFQNLLRGLLTRDPDARMKWSELRKHHFWTQALNEEEDLKEVEEKADKDEQCADRINGRQTDSLDSTKWGHKRIPDPVHFGDQADKNPCSRMTNTTPVHKSSENSILPQTKTTITRRPDSLRKTQGSDRKLVESTTGEEEAKTEDEIKMDVTQQISSKDRTSLDNAFKFKPTSDLDDDNTVFPLSSCATSREACSIFDSLNCSPSPIDAKTATSNDITSYVKALLHTESDRTVTPVLDNPKILKSPPLRFDAKNLGVSACTVEKLLSLSNQEWSVFIQQLSSSLEGQKTSAPTATRTTLNLLCYLCCAVKHKDVANRLINSKVLQALNLLLRQAPNWDVRSFVVRVMGLLAMHCTELEANGAVTEVVSTLSDLLRDNLKNSQVKRFLLPPLGEFLYLIASQEEKRGSPEGLWFVPAAAYTGLMRSLREGDDSIVHHMAAKTLENISTTVSGPSRCLLTTESGSALWYLFAHSNVEAVRITAISALCRLTHRVPSIFLAVIETCGPASIFEAVGGAGPRLQQHLLTAIATALVNSRIQTQHVTQLSDCVLKVLRCLESPSTITRAKAFLLLLILIKDNTHALLFCCQHRLVTYLERDLRKATPLKNHLSQSGYLAQCLDLLAYHLRSTAPLLLEDILCALRGIIGRRHPSLSQSKQLKRTLPSTSILLALLSSQTFRSQIVTEEFLTQMGSLLDSIAHVESNQTNLVSTLGATMCDEWIRTTLSIVEVLSQHNALISPYGSTVVYSILRPLTTLVFSRNAECSAFALRIQSELSLILLVHDDDSGMNTKNTEKEAKSKDQMTAEKKDEDSPANQIVSLFTETLLPRYESLLQAAEPISLYALKLLVSMTEYSTQMCRLINHSRVLPAVFQLIMSNSNTTGGMVQNAVALLCNLSEDSVLDMEPEHHEGLTEVVASALSDAARVHLDGEAAGRKVSHLVLQALLEVLHNILKQTANVVRSALQSQRLSCPTAETDAAEKLLFAFRPLSRLSTHLIHMVQSMDTCDWLECPEGEELVSQLQDMTNSSSNRYDVDVVPLADEILQKISISSTI